MESSKNRKKFFFAESTRFQLPRFRKENFVRACVNTTQERNELEG